jgi:dephospho-CoA kinase
LIFVDAKKKEIKRRLKKRSNYNAEILNKLKKIQLPLEFKKKKSKFLIKNNFKSSYIKKNVKLLKSKILEK